MNRKFLIFLTVISLSFTAFLSGYLVSQKDFHRNPDSIPTGNILDKFNGVSSESNSQINSSNTPKLLGPRNVISPILSKEKDGIIYYEKGTGKVFEITPKNLREKPVSDIFLENLVKTIWAPSRKEVVSVFYYPKGNSYKYFNYKTKSSVDLGTDIESLVFSPDGSQIAYFGTKNDSRGVFISQPDGSALKQILSSRLEDVEVYWPSSELLSFKTTSTNGSELYSLSKVGEVKKILGIKDGLDIKWSEDGSRMLFSQKTESGTSLFYKDINSEKETGLGISTRASKCDWGMSGETVVCGVSRASMSGDEIYEININGAIKLISSPTTKINTSELFLSGLDSHIIIFNSLDNRLYVINK
ncbi:MAG: hypothetical protein UT29_C0001G0081 [Candidatus Yanofskybacteria bacterium GW2011_GWA1_39_13]|uniref:Protein TolB n=1 Tax=Yanofskybacteria sp. (strain GW2011_GWA1_39_13) TaxID=1619019 RepID=A0A0G0MQ94_YANXG|nr:MAG: hypothetical protein UT29_C0001G0081 [Candidatus Yanofskybacteria bacterium GW2011_GWA1_39_13]